MEAFKKSPTSHPSSIIPQKAGHLHNIKPLFQHNPVWRSYDIPKVRKCKPKMVSSVNLTSISSENLNNTTGFRDLIKAFTDSKTLSCLHIENPDLSTKQFSRILNLTNHWKIISFRAARTNQNMNQEFRKSLSRRLGRCKNISTFPFLAYMYEDQISRKTVSCLYRELKTFNRLKSLDLEFPLYEKEIDIFKYRPSRYLTSMTLSFKKTTKITQQNLPQFIAKIQQSCHFLQYLSLDLNRDYNILPSDARAWASFFQNPPSSLKNLKVRVDNEQISVEGIKDFIEALKSFKQLTSLDLAFSPLIPTYLSPQPPQITLNGLLISLFASLQSLTQLEKLELGLGRASLLSNPTLEHFLSMLQKFKNLKNLSVQMSDIESVPQGFEILSEGFKDLARLQVLRLSSDRAKVSSQDIQILSKSLAHLNLTSLSLQFGRFLWRSQRKALALPPTPPSGIMRKLFEVFEKSPSFTPFISNLAQLIQLSHLTLLLSTFHISAKQWREFSLTLKRFKNLSSLSLDLPEFNSKEGIESFSSCLRELPKLTDLKLTFEGENNCDQGIGILASNIVECRNLKFLGLKFQHDSISRKKSQLTDQSLSLLLVAIQKLLNLEQLELLFEDNEFGSQASADFLKGLVVLKQLTNLSFISNQLSIFGCRSAPLPVDLQDYQKLKRMKSFIVGYSRYI